MLHLKEIVSVECCPLEPLVVEVCNLVPLASIIPPFDTPRPRKRLKPHKGRIYFSESILAFQNFPKSRAQSGVAAAALSYMSEAADQKVSTLE